MKNKIFTLSNNIFPTDVVISIGKTKDNIINFLNEKYEMFPEDINHLHKINNTDNICIPLEKTNIIIIKIENHNNLYKSLPILCHELFHCIFNISKIIGIDISDNSGNEWGSYMYEYYFKQLIDILLKDEEIKKVNKGK